MTKEDWEYKKMVKIPKKDLVGFEKEVLKMNSLEEVIADIIHDPHITYDERTLAQAIRTHILSNQKEIIDMQTGIRHSVIHVEDIK